jgi:hypothetical protein
MHSQPAALPRPYLRLFKTWLKWPRDVRCFAPRIDAAQFLANRPDAAEAAHWTEIVLLEDMIFALHRDGTVTRLTHVIIAPHGDQNLAEWDEINRFYDRRKSSVTVRRAVIHLPDGSERRAQRLQMQLDLHTSGLKLTYSPLRPGVIVELEIQDDTFVHDDVGPAMWTNLALQALAPCRRRRLTIAVAEPFAGRLELHHGAVPPHESKVGRYRVLCWDLHDVPGIEADAWTPPPHDFAPWIDLSTLPDWVNVERHYRRELALAPSAGQAVKTLTAELTAKCTGPRDKALAIYNYAARDMRYGRHPSEFDVPTIRDPKRMLEDLRGDCKDKSSLMVALLAESGIPAQIAVLLSAQNGRTPLLPGRRFDHAIVRATVEGSEMWFDPAAGVFTFGTLPQNDQGVKALVLDGGDAHFVDVPLDQPAAQLTERHCRGRLTAGGDYELTAEIAVHGDRGAMIRAAVADRNDDHRRRTIQQAVADERPGAAVTDIELVSIDDLAAPIRYRYRLHLPRWARPVKDLLLFRIPWAEPMEASGPISAPERKLPLQLPNVSRHVESHEIELPDGYEGYALPLAVKQECAGASYELSISCLGPKLVCRRTMETHSGIVPSELFAQFKTFWEVGTRADASDIVLVKSAALTATP